MKLVAPLRFCRLHVQNFSFLHFKSRIWCGKVEGIESQGYAEALPKTWEKIKDRVLMGLRIYQPYLKWENGQGSGLLVTLPNVGLNYGWYGVRVALRTNWQASLIARAHTSSRRWSLRNGQAGRMRGLQHPQLIRLQWRGLIRLPKRATKYQWEGAGVVGQCSDWMSKRLEAVDGCPNRSGWSRHGGN